MTRNKIKGVRTGLGFTQSEVASKLGLSLSSYQKKEQGIMPFTERQKFALAKLFGFTMLETDELLFDGQFGIAQLCEQVPEASSVATLR